MNITDLIIIFNLIILESLLSVDNAAVLAVMVKDLPKDQQPKALKYGMLGAFGFRGLCLFLAAWLVKILWLKIVGGLYLAYLVYGHFTKEHDSIEDGIDDQSVGAPGAIYNFIKSIQKNIGVFWSTVILVEIMDLAFSIDNIFAAVAMTDNFWLIITGVIIGIIAMRFVAQWFTKLMQTHPSLENSAFIVIGLLAIKLIISGLSNYIPGMQSIGEILENHVFDLSFSGVMMLIFFIPILLKK